MMRMWMRWSVVAASVGMGLLPGTGRAQDEAEDEAEVPSRSTLISVQSSGLGMNLLSFQAFGQGAGVEHAVGSNVTLTASVSGGVRSLDSYQLGQIGGLEPSLSWGVRVEPGVHFYLSGRALEGFWVGPHLEAALSRFNSRSFGFSPPDGVQRTDTESRAFSYGGSVRAGYTAILSPGLAVQVGLGLAAINNRMTTISRTSFGEGSMVGMGFNLIPPRYWSVEPRLSVALGWAI